MTEYENNAFMDWLIYNPLLTMLFLLILGITLVMLMTYVDMQFKGKWWSRVGSSTSKNLVKWYYITGLIAVLGVATILLLVANRDPDVEMSVEEIRLILSISWLILLSMGANFILKLKGYKWWSWISSLDTGVFIVLGIFILGGVTNDLWFDGTLDGGFYLIAVVLLLTAGKFKENIGNYT